MASKIDEFRDLLGKVPDEKIAEMAGVKVETVQKYRRDLEKGDDQLDGDAEPDSEPGTISDPVAYEAALAAGEITELDGDDEGDEGDEQDDDEEEERPPAPAPPPKAPRCVRVTRKAIVRGPDRKTWRLGLRDVYRDDDAAYLWEHHRKLVEPFPPQD